MSPKTAAPKRLTGPRSRAGVRAAVGRDADLARIARAYGMPPLWEREEGFATLVLTILEQQVSLASALAAFERLRAAASNVTPESFLKFDDAQLRAFGFSRQKTLYCRLLARAVVDGELDLSKLSSLSDDEARAELTRLKGIGAWTAEIYLLRALLRPTRGPRATSRSNSPRDRSSACPRAPPRPSWTRSPNRGAPCAPSPRACSGSNTSEAAARPSASEDRVRPRSETFTARKRFDSGAVRDLT